MSLLLKIVSEYADNFDGYAPNNRGSESGSFGRVNRSLPQRLRTKHSFSRDYFAGLVYNYLHLDFAECVNSSRLGRIRWRRQVEGLTVKDTSLGRLNCFGLAAGFSLLLLLRLRRRAWF